MMKTNVAAKRNPKTKGRTYEGAVAQTPNAKEELQRAVVTCLLFENTFYEKGNDIAERIAQLVPQVDPQVVAQLADDTRNKYGLRHVSLFLVRELARHPQRHKVKVASCIESVIQRADELAEFLSLYWAT
jgi:hypothetical protein